MRQTGLLHGRRVKAPDQGVAVWAWAGGSVRWLAGAQLLYQEYGSRTRTRVTIVHGGDLGAWSLARLKVFRSTSRSCQKVSATICASTHQNRPPFAKSRAISRKFMWLKPARLFHVLLKS